MSTASYLLQNIALGIRHWVELNRVLAQGHTPTQRYRILELKALGRCIELSGCIQSSEFDESYYHESLIFPAFAFNQTIKRVLCFGGANGGLLNRLCLVPSIEEVVQIDIDPQLYEISRHYLPFLHPHEPLPFKYNLHFHSSPYEWLQALSVSELGQFDLVIADLPDATGDSYVPQLFTRSFYDKIKSLLSETGAIATQAGQLNTLDMGFHLRARATMQACFTHVASYASFVPSYGTPWGFLYASNNINPEHLSHDDMMLNLSIIDLSKLKYYDLQSHMHSFSLSKPIRCAMNDSRIAAIQLDSLATVDIAGGEEKK
jgi:spermidine synthase